MSENRTGSACGFLIVGGDSLIGRSVQQHLEDRGIPVAVTSRRGGDGLRVDLSEPPEKWVLPPSVDVAVLCAARTKLKDCADHPAETALVNVTRTVELARRLHERGALVIFPSTNLVFSGTRPTPSPSDAQDPVTEYGRQKAATEDALLASGGRSAILRPTKIVHRGLPLFVEWSATLRRGEAIHPFLNAPLCPFPLQLFAQLIATIGIGRHEGVFHFSADRDLPYSDAAALLARTIGVPSTLVRPRPAPTPSPRFSTLGCQSTEETLHLTMPKSVPTLEKIFASHSND